MPPSLHKPLGTDHLQEAAFCLPKGSLSPSSEPEEGEGVDTCSSGPGPHLWALSSGLAPREHGELRWLCWEHPQDQGLSEEAGPRTVAQVPSHLYPQIKTIQTHTEAQERRRWDIHKLLRGMPRGKRVSQEGEVAFRFYFLSLSLKLLPESFIKITT